MLEHTSGPLPAHSHRKELALQILGMGCGITIMLLIALYEKNLAQMFSNY